MTIIDQFISDNRHKMIESQMARTLGVPQYLITSRIKTLDLIDRRKAASVSYEVRDEITALKNYIWIHKKGFFVEAAKERIKKLEYLNEL